MTLETSSQEALLESSEQRLPTVTAEHIDTALNEQLQFLNENFKGDNEKFDLFLNFFRSLPKNEKDEIIKWLKNRSTDASKYFSKEGYPINQETYTKFTKRYNITFQSGGEIAKNGVEAKYIEYHEKLKTISKALEREKFKKFDEFFKLQETDNAVSAIDKVFIEKDSFIQRLSPQEFTEFIALIRESDKVQGLQGKESAYEQLKSVAIWVNPSLAERFATIDIPPATPDSAPTLLQQTQINAMFENQEGGKIEKDGTLFKQGNLSIDISKNPPEAYMSTSWDNKYNLPVDMPVADFYPAIAKYEAKKQPLEAQVKGIDSAIDYINSLHTDKISQNQKETFKRLLWEKLYKEFDIEHGNIKDIAQNLIKVRTTIISELKVLEEEYHDSLKSHAKSYADSQKAKKETIQKRLDFLSSIGFDVIPQYITDMIIVEINRGVYGTPPEPPIDLANGNFGIKNDDPDRITQEEKKAFIKLVNRMYSGTEERPIDIATFSNEFSSAKIEIPKLKEQLATSGVFSNNSDWHIEKICANLRQKASPKRPK